MTNATPVIGDLQDFDDRVISRFYAAHVSVNVACEALYTYAATCANPKTSVDARTLADELQKFADLMVGCVKGLEQ